MLSYFDKGLVSNINQLQFPITPWTISQTHFFSAHCGLTKVKRWKNSSGRRSGCENEMSVVSCILQKWNESEQQHSLRTHAIVSTGLMSELCSLKKIKKRGSLSLPKPFESDKLLFKLHHCNMEAVCLQAKGQLLNRTRHMPIVSMFDTYLAGIWEPELNDYVLWVKTETSQ